MIIIDAVAIAELWQDRDAWRRGDEDGDDAAGDPDNLTGDPAGWAWIKRRAIEDEAEGRLDRSMMTQSIDGRQFRILSNGVLQDWRDWCAERGHLVRAQLVARFGSWPDLTA